MDAITQLKKWLDKPGNDKLKLAYLLGYKSAETIRLWIIADKIPTFHEHRVLEVIKLDKDKKYGAINKKK